MLATRLVTYQSGLERDAPDPIDDPAGEARELTTSVAQLRPHIRLWMRVKGLFGAAEDTMLVTWTEFLSRSSTVGLQELAETEYAQVRYGDIAMALVLPRSLGLRGSFHLARLVLRPAQAQPPSFRSRDRPGASEADLGRRPCTRLQRCSLPGACADSRGRG